MRGYQYDKVPIPTSKTAVKCCDCGQEFLVPETTKRAKCPNPDCDKYVVIKSKRRAKHE